MLIYVSGLLRTIIVCLLETQHASTADKDMHAEVREEAKDLMKLILDRNSEYEGRAVSGLIRSFGC